MCTVFAMISLIVNGINEVVSPELSRLLALLHSLFHQLLEHCMFFEQ
jgi:hypothetical protein